MVAIRDECTRRDLEVDDDVANRLLRVKTGLTDDHGNESGLDLWVHDPGIPGPARIEQIGDLQVAVLSKPQIIYGKLQRSNEGLIRDAYDIAHARVKDRRALETAVNSLDPNHQQRAEMAYGTRSKLMELEPGQILGWSGKTADDQTGCGMRASHAIHDSRWTRLVIRAQEGRIFAETTNTAGETLNWLGENGTPIPEAVEHLETAGIISHLQNQYAGQNCNLADIVRRIAGSVDRLETIVHTEPGPSTNKTPRASVFTGKTGPEPPRIGGPQRPSQELPGLGSPSPEPVHENTNTATQSEPDNSRRVVRGAGREIGGKPKLRKPTGAMAVGRPSPAANRPSAIAAPKATDGGRRRPRKPRTAAELIARDQGTRREHDHEDHHPGDDDYKTSTMRLSSTRRRHHRRRERPLHRRSAVNEPSQSRLPHRLPEPPDRLLHSVVVNAEVKADRFHAGARIAHLRCLSGDAPVHGHPSDHNEAHVERPTRKSANVFLPGRSLDADFYHGLLRTRVAAHVRVAGRLLPTGPGRSTVTWTRRQDRASAGARMCGRDEYHEALGSEPAAAGQGQRLLAQGRRRRLAPTPPTFAPPATTVVVRVGGRTQITLIFVRIHWVSIAPPGRPTPRRRSRIPSSRSQILRLRSCWDCPVRC